MTMFLSYRNQSVHLLCKSTNWFLHDGHIGSSRVNSNFMTDIFKLLDSQKPARKQNVLNLNVTRPI